MERYSKNNLKIDKDGKRVYKTTYYPEIPLENSDEFIMVTDGTRIDNLAFQRYGDPSLWWIIAKANGIKGKVVLNIGDLIRIPSNVSKIIGKFKDLNRSV
tara:strand:+ start:365 stop:664 length:300 start_codon:yes stop_codon:yes gene_type:complete